VWSLDGVLCKPAFDGAGGQDRQSASAGAAAMQWGAGRNPHLSARLSKQDSVPGIPSAIRAADAKRYSARLYGWQECLR